MFDMGVAHLIEGAEILTPSFHQFFSDFQIYFEPDLDDVRPHTYRIASFLPAPILRDRPLPITLTLYLADDRTIDPPSQRLLAIHCAIAHILPLRSGDYIDHTLRDAEELGVQEDGSTELGR